jgi:hypothetical protein
VVEEKVVAAVVEPEAPAVEKEADTSAVVPETETAAVVPEIVTEAIVPEAVTALVVPEAAVVVATVAPESPASETTAVSVEPETIAVAAVSETAVVEPETVAEESKPEVVEVAVADKPAAVKTEEAEPEPEEAPGRARSYTIQFMALRKPVDLQYFRGLSDISLTLDKDNWYRYTCLTTTDSIRAASIKGDLVSKGFTDAFIRRKSIIPRFTIQVMAVPGPVTDLNVFSNLPEISVRKDSDTFCRYTTGWYETKDDARNALAQVKSLGYTNAFVRKVKTLQ